MPDDADEIGGGSIGLEYAGGWFRGIVSELHSAGLPLSVHSNALEAARAVKTEPGLLFGFSVYSTLATPQFIQVFDTERVPGAGEVPAAVFHVNGASLASGDHLAVSYIFPGRFHRYGIWIVNSTTAATLTAGAANCFFDVQYV